MIDGTKGTGGGHLDRAGTRHHLTSDHILETNLLTSLRDRVGVKEKRGKSHGQGRAVRKVIFILDALVCVPLGHWTVRV